MTIRCPSCKGSFVAEDDAQRACRHVTCPYRPETVNHPAHYGGANNQYEAILVIEAWGLGFCLGNCVKYVCRAGRKGDLLEDLRKARWYLDREIATIEGKVHI